MRQEDLSKVSGVSIKAIKNLEGGGRVEFVTFLRVAKALNMDKAIWEVCKPNPSTLEELLNVESARKSITRVRLAK